MTSQEPENPPFAEPDVLDTEVFSLGAEGIALETEVISVAAPAPVFVDSTGRRSRRLRRLAYAFGALVMIYGGLISVSLAGGPVRSSAVLPLPGLEPRKDDEVPPRPSPTPAPSPSPTPTDLFVTDALPGRATAPRGTGPRLESTRIPGRSGARPNATKKATSKPTGQPVESATTSPGDTPVTTPSTTAPTTASTIPSTNPVPPEPPIAGGQGGGTTVETPKPSASGTSDSEAESGPEADWTGSASSGPWNGPPTDGSVSSDSAAPLAASSMATTETPTETAPSADERSACTPGTEASA